MPKREVTKVAEPGRGAESRRGVVDAKPGGLWGKTAASQQRRRDILQAAKAVFLEDGYQLASMERVAEVAKTTKRTLYDHFGSKEALWSATIAHCCEMFLAKLPSVDELPDEPRAAIAQFIERMAAVLREPSAIRLQRIVIAEAERNPAFSQQLHEAAFGATEGVLRRYLERQVARGALAAHDVGAWTRMLVGLATDLGHTRALLGVANVRDSDESPRPRAKRPADRDARVRDEVIAMYVDAHRAAR